MYNDAWPGSGLEVALYLSGYPRTSVSNTLNNMKPTQMLRAFPAAVLLLLAGACPSLAFGDLFDGAYTDCPAAVRMREGPNRQPDPGAGRCRSRHGTGDLGFHASGGLGAGLKHLLDLAGAAG